MPVETVPTAIDSDRSFYLIPTSCCFPCEHWSGTEESSQTHARTHAHAPGQPRAYATACAINSWIAWAAWELRERRCGSNAGAAQATIGVTVLEPNRARWLQPLAPRCRSGRTAASPAPLPAPLRCQPCPHNFGSPAACRCRRALLLPSARRVALPGGSWSGKLERRKAGRNDGDVFSDSSTGSNLKSVSCSVRWKGHLVLLEKKQTLSSAAFGVTASTCIPKCS